MDASNTEVTDCYNLTVRNGSLLIKSSANSIVLTVTAPSQTWVYDGEAHTYQDPTKVTVSGLVDGDTITEYKYASSSTITNVGTQANIISSVVIKSSSGAVVDPAKYAIKFVPGTLTVSKYSITVTAESDSKNYDGKALVNKKVTVTKLANSDHKISIDYSVTDSNGTVTSAINPGTYDKKITNVKIMDGNTDVTDNYDIKKVHGTLTVKGTGTETPKTGDDSNIGIWIALLAVSAVVIVGIVIIVVKKGKQLPEAQAEESSEDVPEDEE